MVTYNIFRILGSTIALYSLLCCIRIVLTWVPSVSFSKPVYWLARICDPFLNIFRRLRFLRLGNIDFSPAIALCVLGMAGTVLNGLANSGKFSFAAILALCIQLVFSLASTIISFFIIVMAIRLVILMFSSNKYNSFYYMIESLDRSISGMVCKMAGIFKKNASYKASLIIAIVELVVVNVILTAACNVILRFIEGWAF